MMQKNPHEAFLKLLAFIPCYRSLICLNGHLPDKDFFQLLPLPIIAADGAANLLDKQGIAPDLIIGDLDSVDPDLLSRYPTVKIDDQSSNDFQKVLAHLKELHLLPAIVLGINGGYLDHILCNISVFIQENCLLYDPPHTIGYLLKAGAHFFDILPVMSKVSLIGAPYCKVSSSGLKWELSHHSLKLGENCSFFNRVLSPRVSLQIEEGSLLVLLYLESILDAGSH
jgi:thiamine pyrophosphokinase